MPQELNIKQIERKTCKQLVNIALNLRKLRADNQYTQMMLAVHLNCSESFVSGIECGRYSDISLLTLNKICAVFEIDMKDLLL